MEDNFRAAADPTIEILLLFSGVWRLVKYMDAVFIKDLNHVLLPFGLSGPACDRPIGKVTGFFTVAPNRPSPALPLPG
jgi:hypothetical protein